MDDTTGWQPICTSWKLHLNRCCCYAYYEAQVVPDSNKRERKVQLTKTIIRLVVLLVTYTRGDEEKFSVCKIGSVPPDFLLLATGFDVTAWRMCCFVV